MSRRRSQDVTIREGTRETHWYLLAAYVAFSILLLGYTYWEQFQSGSELRAGIVLGFAGILWFGTAILVYPALFKDSAYIRSQTYTWMPKWWYYILSGIGIPILIFLGSSQVVPTLEAFTFGLTGFTLITILVAAVYLYQRHRHIGVP